MEMKFFNETIRKKLEIIFFILVIILPLILLYTEPFVFIFNDKISDFIYEVRPLIWQTTFYIFCFLTILNSFLIFFKTKSQDLRESITAKIFLIVVLFILFLTALNNGLKTFPPELQVLLIYFSLLFYGIFTYFRSIISWYKDKPHQVLFILSGILIFSWLIFTFHIFGLYLKIENISLKEDMEIGGRIDNLEMTTNALLDEKNFEEEIRDNLVYYLPEEYKGKVFFMGLTPLKFLSGSDRVYFLYYGKRYSVDLSFSNDNGRLTIHRESPVVLAQ